MPYNISRCWFSISEKETLLGRSIIDDLPFQASGGRADTLVSVPMVGAGRWRKDICLLHFLQTESNLALSEKIHKFAEEYLINIGNVDKSHIHVTY